MEFQIDFVDLLYTMHIITSVFFSFGQGGAGGKTSFSYVF